ncbi:MAG: hypothetical protein JO345_29655 [Streptosporangiaceae bacterium]|nr:hypothetical protein [Streptosporangiaceae bacterium]
MKGRQEDGQGRHSAAHAAQTTRNGHVDPDVLAEFRAGLIADHGLVTGRRGRAIAAHVSGCAACAALDARLAQVSAVLAAAPVPAVPDAVARRLDGALAALAAESQKPISSERLSEHPAPRTLPSGAGAAGGGASGSGASQNGRSRNGAEWGRRLLRVRVLAPAAAALAALAGAGYGLSNLVPSSSYSTPMANSAAGTANSTHHPASLPSGAAGAARAPTAENSNATFTPNRDQGAKNKTGTGTYSSGDQVFVVSSDLDYRPATLGEQVTAQLRDSKALRAVPASAAVTACVLNVTDGNPRLLVETAQYDGTPATIVVIPGTAGDVVWVAGPGCTATVSDILNHEVLSPGTTAP